MKFQATAVFQAALAIVFVSGGSTAYAADDKIAIFEAIHASSVSFAETATAVEAGLRASGLTLHAVHDVRVPDDAQQARVYVLTSPEYLEAAAGESARTVSLTFSNRSPNSNAKGPAKRLPTTPPKHITACFWPIRPW